MLYKQFDGKVRRVEIIDIADDDDDGGDDEDVVKYRIELDARELTAPEDRLSAIPKVAPRPPIVLSWLPGQSEHVTVWPVLPCCSLYHHTLLLPIVVAGFGGGR